MGLNHKQAEFYAPQLHHYTKSVEPRLTVGGVISELKNVPNDDPVAIMAAAWSTVRKMRSGEYRAFSKLGDELVKQYLPAESPAPVLPAVRPYQRGSSHQPINPRVDAECPEHEGQWAANCGPCRVAGLVVESPEYPSLVVRPDLL